MKKKMRLLLPSFKRWRKNSAIWFEHEIIIASEKGGFHYCLVLIPSTQDCNHGQLKLKIKTTPPPTHFNDGNKKAHFGLSMNSSIAIIDSGEGGGGGGGFISFFLFLLRPRVYIIHKKSPPVEG